MFKNNALNIIVTSIVLLLIGLLMIYSSSYVWSLYKFNTKYHYLIYQIIFSLISLTIFKLISRMDLSFLKTKTNLILLFGLLLLIVVLIPGIGVIRNGSRSWFSLGPVSFQPSELMKLVLIIFTSKYLEKYHLKINKVKEILFPLLIIIGISIFLIMLEPDFGTSMVIILTLFIMIFCAGLKYKYILYIFLFGIIGIIGIIISAPYRLMRIISFLNPWKDPLGSGYQIIQSLYAIAPGGLFGHGLFSSRQKHFYLPEPQTDFIFSILCEELGFIVAVIVVLLFLFLFINIVSLSIKEKNIYNKFLILGIGASLFVQTVMNLSVVVGLIPVTGVTLPFFSYGGSSLLTSFISLGIIINISRNN